jgi:hypothetical protein
MPPVEFEEKEIEGPLNAYLASNGLIWSPGQVLEQIVGFDVAIKVQLACFWASLGYPSIPSGDIVLPSWWPVIVRHHFDERTPPPFELNVFLQYKRPHYLYGGNAKERRRWPTGTYYRFILDTEQQTALEACASSLDARGIVAYATPAFWKRNALFNHIKLGTLMDNTHFVKAIDLRNHTRYTYVDARNNGQAFSKPTEILPFHFAPRENRRDPALHSPMHGGGDGRGDPPRDTPPDGGDGNRRSPAELLNEARAAAEAAVTASPDRVGGVANFRERQANAVRLIGGAREEHLISIRDFTAASVYTWLSGLSWAIQ